MITLHYLLMVSAFVCFALAAFGVPAKVNLLALGLALWVLNLILV